MPGKRTNPPFGKKVPLKIAPRPLWFVRTGLRILQQQLPMIGGAEAVPIPAGWSLNCSVAPNGGYCGEVWASRNGVVNAGQCGLTGQAMITPNYASSAALFASLNPLATAARTIIVGQYWTIGGGCNPASLSSRQRYLRIYHKPAGVPNGAPTPARDPVFWPNEWPTPFAPPGFSPAPSPSIKPTTYPREAPETERGPAPRPRPAPRPSPGGRPEPGGRPRPRPRPDPAPGPGPGPVIAPWPEGGSEPPPGGFLPIPEPEPGTGTTIVFDPGYVPVVAEPPVKERPPEKRTKEKKFAVSKDLAIFGLITESMDAISALYKALPWCVRPVGFVGPDKMAKAIYDELEYIDWQKAITNLVANQVEDAVIGRIESKLQEMSVTTGLNIGWGTAIRRAQAKPAGTEYSEPFERAAAAIANTGFQVVMPNYAPKPVPKDRCAAKWGAIRHRARAKRLVNSGTVGYFNDVDNLYRTGQITWKDRQTILNRVDLNDIWQSGYYGARRSERGKKRNK